MSSIAGIALHVRYCISPSLAQLSVRLSSGLDALCSSSALNATYNPRWVSGEPIGDHVSTRSRPEVETASIGANPPGAGAPGLHRTNS